MMTYTKEEIEKKPRLLFGKKRDMSAQKARPGTAKDSLSTKKHLRNDRSMISQDNFSEVEISA